MPRQARVIIEVREERARVCRHEFHRSSDETGKIRRSRPLLRCASHPVWDVIAYEHHGTELAALLLVEG